MTDQLDLLAYEPTATELAEPTPEQQAIVRSRLSRCEINWLDAKQFYYLKLINCFTEAGMRDKESGNADPVRQAMRRYEIVRLERLRSVALKQIEFLEGVQDVEP
ncbi:MAG TPA: hypothetical protein V6D10_07015 [Trichocoleus sp.]|jgi:hypothetical protein